MLAAVLAAPFDPSADDIAAYELRIARVVSAMNARGLSFDVDAVRQAGIQAHLVARACGDTPGLPQYESLIAELTRLLNEQAAGRCDAALAERIDTLLGLLAGIAPGDVASTRRGVAAVAQEASGAGASAPPSRPHVATPERRPLASALDAAAAAAPVPGKAAESPASPSSPERLSEMGELVRLLKEGSRGGGPPERAGEHRSTIQIRPNIVWPSLGDTDHDVQAFIDDYEDVVGLANDGRGMSAKEKLRCFGACLKASRAKVYKVVVRESKLKGLLDDAVAGHAQVYDTVCARLMEFEESMLERQNRVEVEWNALVKGSRTALQFLPMFEAAVAELELAELGMAARPLLLGYLRKVGNANRMEILRDRRGYVKADKTEEIRTVDNWREAHRILVEFEACQAGNRALVGAVGMLGGADASAETPEEKAQQDRAALERSAAHLGTTAAALIAATGAWPASPNSAVAAVPFAQRPCFEARDTGACTRTMCSFSHDAAILDAARKDKAARPQGNGGRGGGKGGGGRGAPRTDPKKARAKGEELCLNFAQGSCKRGDGCRFSHAAARVDSLRAGVVAHVAATQAQAQPAWPPAPYQAAPPPGPPSAGGGALGPAVAPPDAVSYLQWCTPPGQSAVFPS
ncbi:MAG TPA: zinc finger CCCH domain-containing protein, partial [Rhodothermales bacterium]|nr:zinc finger CCCH domain-containing protein [Rhodothermales bacterium]